MISRELYGPVPYLSETIKRRRLAPAGHVSRHNEPEGKVLLWTPEEPRRVGRSNTTLKKVLEDEIGLEVKELQKALLVEEACHVTVMDADCTVL